MMGTLKSILQLFQQGLERIYSLLRHSNSYASNIIIEGIRQEVDPTLRDLERQIQGNELEEFERLDENLLTDMAYFVRNHGESWEMAMKAKLRQSPDLSADFETELRHVGDLIERLGNVIDRLP